jgi:hypothetical protein
MKAVSDPYRTTGPNEEYQRDNVKNRMLVYRIFFMLQSSNSSDDTKFVLRVRIYIDISQQASGDKAMVRRPAVGKRGRTNF